MRIGFQSTSKASVDHLWLGTSRIPGLRLSKTLYCVTTGLSTSFSAWFDKNQPKIEQHPLLLKEQKQQVSQILIGTPDCQQSLHFK